MLLTINNMIKEYEPVINLMWAIFPFLVTVFMAYVAYQQYKMSQYKEYCEFKNRFETDFGDITSNFEKDFDNILKSEEKGKIKKIIALISTLEPKFEKYEDLFDAIDAKFIKESYKQLKKWFEENDSFKWNWNYIKGSFNVITDFISAIIYAKGGCMENPLNSTVTIYQLAWKIWLKIIGFITPLPIQKFYKKYIRRFIFKIKSIYYIIVFIIYLIKIFFFSNDTKTGNSKNENNLKEDNKNAK